MVSGVPGANFVSRNGRKLITKREFVGQLAVLNNKERITIWMGVLPKTAYNRKGCVDTALIDCVDISSYVFPVLHVMIGIGNKLISDFFESKAELRCHFG